VALEDAFAALHHDLGKRRREEAAQPRHPPELFDLLRHPRLERVVQRGQLARLGADGVVVALDPDERTDPQQQLLLVERLRHEVVGAGADPVDPGLAAVRGDHHDGDERGCVVLADAAADLVAVHPCHLDVEQDEVGQLPGDEFQRLGARRRRADREARGGEDRLEQPHVRLYVVDDEDPLLGLRLGAHLTPSGTPAPGRGTRAR
jgi:hypothetical protein